MRIDGTNPPVQPASVAPTMPFRLARAYGAPQPVQPAPEPASPTRPSTVSRLIAGVAPGGISFDSPQAAPSENLTMYRHPADRNAAATGVSLGRSLDVSG